MDENSKLIKTVNTVKGVSEKVGEKVVILADEVKNDMVQIKDTAVVKQNERKISMAEKKRQEEIKKLSPIFPEDIANGELLKERFIRIINYDARLENEYCEGSIGYYEKSEDRILPTFYAKYVDTLGLSFYPQTGESVYVADPCIKGKYIEIDGYYDYMRQVRVNELTVLAQALGAKSVIIELRDSKKASMNSSITMDINAGKLLKGKGNKIGKRLHSRNIEIWASTTFETSAFYNKPSVPELMYFKNESDISALIQMVTTNKSKVTERKYSMKANASSGISLSEAASISSTLKKINCNAGTSFSKSAENESHSYLDYTIAF